MAREDVHIKVTADEAESLRMWRAMRQGPEGVASELENLQRRGQRASRGITHELEGFIGKWASITAGIQAAQNALRAYGQEQKRLAEQRGQAFTTLDQAAREFLVQGDLPLTSQSLNRALQQISATAIQRKVLPSFAGTAAVQLVSSGFDQREVLEGGGLDVFLQGLAAANQAGRAADPRQTAEAVVQFLTSNALPRTTENLRRALVTTQANFRGSNIQLADLEFLARQSSLLASRGFTPELQIGAFAELRNRLPAEVAATQLGAIVTRLSAQDTETQRALRGAGLDPRAVDLVGEDPLTALRRLRAARARLAPEDRGEFEKAIASRGNIKTLSLLLAPGVIEEISRAQDRGRSDEGFRRAVEIAEKSQAADERQATAQEQVAAATRGEPSLAATRSRLNAILDATDANFLQRLDARATLAGNLFFGRGAEESFSQALRTIDATGVGVRGFVGTDDVNDILSARPGGALQFNIQLRNTDGVDIPADIEAENIGAATVDSTEQ